MDWDHDFLHYQHLESKQHQLERFSDRHQSHNRQSAEPRPAHLAGALGKPVWLLNRFGGCWMEGRAADLQRLMEAERAEEEGERITRGRPVIHNDIMNSKAEQGTSSTYLLRSLARKSLETLAAYERGEFRSVRAAAISASTVFQRD
jgi:hypothetical protein